MIEFLKSAGVRGWAKFVVASVLWVSVFVVWMRSPWMLLGLVVIFDIYISKYFSRYVGEWHRRLRERSGVYRVTFEWVEAIVFAVVVASLIHTFIFQLFVIPTPSMEKSLLVGDYLYVSKLSYGPRTPNTPLSVPLVHNVMPVTGGKSYSTAIQWDYKRLRGPKKIERGDVVVFNYPADPVPRPVDKRENYVKRCVALPGDSLVIVESRLYVNGEEQPVRPGQQQVYHVVTDAPFSATAMREMQLERDDVWYNPPTGEYIVPLTRDAVDRVEAMTTVRYVSRYERDSGDEIFPNDGVRPWSENDFGPLWVPAKGATVRLTAENVALYERIIGFYEGNRLEVRGEDIFVNGVRTDSYTFAMDYYWMMGDNRDNSLDSRYWGFVPEDHIVGKASFVWLSLDKNRTLFDGKIRWRKMFRKIR